METLAVAGPWMADRKVSATEIESGPYLIR
jgi:hypothetical protein